MSDPPILLRAAKRRRMELYWLKKNKFYSTTPFSGFTLIQTAGSKIETLFWYLVVIAFTIWTIHDVTKLVGQYRKGQTTTSVEIAHDKHGTLDNFAFCMEVPWLRLPTDDYTLGYENYGNTSWSLVTLVRAAQKLSYFEKAEASMLRHWDVDTDYKWREEELNDVGSELNMGVAQLYEMTGTELLNVFTPIISYSTIHEPGANDHTEFTSDMRLISIFMKVERDDKVMFCYHAQPPTSETVRHAGLHFRTDNIGGNSKWWNNLTREDEDRMRSLRVYVYLNGNYHIKSPNIQAKLPVKIVSDVKFAAVYKLDPAASSCRHFTTIYEKEQCKSTKLAEVLAMKCGCAQISNQNLHNDSTICDFDNYEKCHTMHPNTSPMLEARDEEECGSCDHNTYQVATQKRFPRDQRRMQIDLNHNPDSYAVFSEQIQSKEDFLASVGGMIDLWLGASVIGIVHLVVFVSKQLFYAIKHEKGAKNKIKSMLRHFKPAPLVVAAMIPCDDEEEDNVEMEEIIKRLADLEETMEGFSKDNNENSDILVRLLALEKRVLKASFLLE